MSFDDDADEDAPGFRRPPHPDDRLWRHPSEVGQGRRRTARAVAASPRSGRGHRRGTAALVAVAGAVAGFVLAALVLDSGGSSSEDEAATTAAGRSPAAGPEAAIAEQLSPALVAVPALARDDGDGRAQSDDGTESGPAGAGVIVSEDGIVLTSNQLVGQRGSVTVRLAGGAEVDAAVVGADPVTGIAVLDLPGEGHPTVATARAADLAPGTPAFSVGVDDSGAAATPAVLEGSHRLTSQSGWHLDGVVAIEGEAAPGSLGGPVVNEAGAVIGITTASGGEGQPASYITPVNVGRRVADDLLATGRARHGWLGIEGRDASAASTLSGSDTVGALVSTVVAGGPAEAAGLRESDVIVEIDGRPVATMSDLILGLRFHGPGATADLVVERDGERLAIAVPLGEPPPAS